MNDDIDDDPMHDSLEGYILAERRQNDIRAAEMTRAFVAELAADGLHLAPGVEEALTARNLKLLNDHLERELAEVAQHMRESLLPPPTVH